MEQMTATDSARLVLLLSARQPAPERLERCIRSSGLRCISRLDPRLADGYETTDEIGFAESPDCLTLWAEALDATLYQALSILRLEYPEVGILVMAPGGDGWAIDAVSGGDGDGRRNAEKRRGGAGGNGDNREDLGTPGGSVAAGATGQSARGDAIRAGADALLDPDVDRDRLLFTVNRLLELSHMRRELQYLRRRDATGATLGNLVGSCTAMREVFSKVLTLCRRSSRVQIPPPVLITGETGTGKGQIARAIHYNGQRRDQALVEVNCASLPGSLIEAELFGHERGAFTGAVLARPGLIEVAHRGSIFLDDIATLGPELQAKLLRFLDDRRVRRLGSTAERFIDVQLIAATHRDLEAAVQIGEFREDLFFRLGVMHIHLPPLRERGDDVLDMARSFVEERCSAYGSETLKISPAAEEAMRSYRWPGNIRELRNRLERIVLLQDSPVIEPHHLELPSRSGQVSCAGGQVKVSFSPQGIQLDEVIQTIIDHALEKTGGNLSRAARLLGVTRSSLRYRLGR